MTAAYWVTSDTRTAMAAMPEGSVDLVLCSPPFLRLRDYLDADDPAKADEIGQEGNPGEFVDTLLEVAEACGRVLTRHGSLAFELGDTYAGSGGAGGDYDSAGLRKGQNRARGSAAAKWERTEAPHGWGPFADQFKGGSPGGAGWPLDKSLALIPETFRFALAYGFNPHTGRKTDPWKIRNVIRWCKPNPPPGALGDKFRPGTSEIVVACKARDRWFDMDAVRTQLRPSGGLPMSGTRERDREGRGRREPAPVLSNPAGAPPNDWWKIDLEEDDAGAPEDWWEIPSRPYKGAHHAVYPPALLERPIEAMCPRRVCRTCGIPSRRIVEKEEGPTRDRHTDGRRADLPGAHGDRNGAGETIGWTTCGCPSTDGIRLDGFHDGIGWRPGVVLDPFGGSGTTAMVASGHGRVSVSIDLDHRNADLARGRVGPLWFHEVADLAELTTAVEGWGVQTALDFPT